MTDNVTREGRSSLWRQCWPLSYHLILLALAIILPLLALAGVGLRNSFQAERQTSHASAERAADSAMARFDREVLGAITMLTVMSRDSAFDRGDYKLLYDRCKDAMFERKGELVLVSLDNKVIFSTAAPFGAGTPAAPGAVPFAAMTPQPFVTDLVAGGPSEQPKFAVIVPVIRKGQAAASLYLTVEPAELTSHVTEAGLAPGWDFALVDRAGKTIASTSTLARVGDAVPKALFAGAREESGLFDVKDAADRPLLSAYRRSQLTGWTGYALIPLETLETPLSRIWRDFFATGFTFLAISLAAAYVLSRRMTRPIYGLTRAALALGRGETYVMPPSSLLEANLLSDALRQAASQIHRHTEALSESDRRFRSFADQTEDAIWFLDLKKGRIEYISPAFEKIWGRPKDDVSGMEDWRKTVHPDDVPLLDAAIAERGVGRVQAQYRIVRPDGGVRWVRDSRFPLTENGKPPRVIAGIVRDFTERRDAIENLTRARAEAEHRFAELQHLYESSPIGLAVVGHDHRFERINDFMARIKGRSPEDLIGRPLFELLPEMQSVAEPLLPGIFQGRGAVKGAEFQTLHEGRAPVFWEAHFYPIVVKEGNVAGIGIILENITEEKLHQQALAGLAAIVYAANDAMFSTSRSGAIMNWNPAAEALFQYKPGEVAGKPFSMVFPDGEAGAFKTLFDEVRQGDSSRIDTELRRKDGTAIPVSISAAPIRGGDEDNAVSITIEDITERKRFEDRQLLMNRELAHRVKNSLAVIQAMARHTLRTSPTPQAFARAFEGRLQALSTSHNLLTASQWEGADLAELIREQLAPDIVGTDRLRLAGPTVKLPPGIATSLGLVLHELSTNAAKFGALAVPGGKVDVAWEVTGAGGDSLLRLDWRESGGPKVSPPHEKGFGSTLIEYSGKVVQEFAPEGLRCTVEMVFSDGAPRTY